MRLNYGKVLDKDQNRIVWASQVKCPRCRGFGAAFKDDYRCDICNGHGKVWMTLQGWTRALYARLENSKRF